MTNHENIKILPVKKSASTARREYIRAIAGKIQSLVVDENFAPRDIMVLMQRRNPFASLLVNELKSRGLEVAGSDRIILPEFPAIRDLLNLLRFCIDQRDDYALCCTLRSPLYRLKELDIFHICKERENSKDAAVFDVLRNLHADIHSEISEIIEWSKTMAPYSFFTQVLNSRDRREKMIAALGTQIIDPLEEFLTICLAYERTRPGTLRHFLKWFITGGSEIKRDMDAAAGVRVATVHGSKGLEAPVVFLIDTIRTPKDKPEKIFPAESAPRQPAPLETRGIGAAWLWSPQKNGSEKLAAAAGRAMNSKIAEYYRLLYVAMTRARDRLYIYGFTTNKKPSEIAWHTKLMEIMPGMPGAIFDDEAIRISD
jgi:ATP-dependent helicase/nuclease subunit A